MSISPMVIPEYMSDNLWPVFILFLSAETVAHTYDGVDEFLVKTLINFLPQVSHVDIHDIGVGIEILVPHVAQQLPARQRLTLVAYEILQQPVLLSAQFHLGILAPRLVVWQR